MTTIDLQITTAAPSEPDSQPLPGDEESEQETAAQATGHSHYEDPRFALLHQANLAFNASLELADVLQSVLDFVIKALPASGASLWLLEPGSDEMVCHQALGTGSDDLTGRRLDRQLDLLKQVVESGHTLVVTGQPTLPALQLLPLEPTASPTRSLLAAPLLPSAASMAPVRPGAGAAHAEKSVVGIILLTSTTPHAFSCEDRSLLEAMAASASAAIGSAELCTRARREIGEGMNTEQALRESESRYRTLIETSPDAILVANLQGTISLCNNRALELYGYQEKRKLIGKSLLSLAAPEMRLLAGQHFQRVGRGEVTGSIELLQTREDGTTFDAEYVAALIANSRGEAGGIVAFVKDITERKGAERIIRRHNVELQLLNTISREISQMQDRGQLLATALDLSLQALEVDTGWAIIFGDDTSDSASERSLLVERGSMRDASFLTRKTGLREWLEAEVRTKRTPVLGSTEDVAQVEAGLEPGCQIVGVPLQVGERIDGVIAVVGLDHGHPRPLRLRQVQLLWAIGHQVSIALENARLSAREAEIEMRHKLDAMRSDLLASFSHDLRSPLGIITMICSTLLRQEVQLDQTAQQELLVDVQTQSARLLRLVDGILDLGRLQNGHLWLNRRLMDLGDLMRQMGPSIQKLTERHTIALRLPDYPLWVVADSDRMEQVLHNLLDNAIKYTPDGGPIEMRAERQQHHIVVSVTNQGIGIAADQLELVFERFYRIRSETTQHISGAGLGLATCRGIVEAHGGTIRAENDVEQGTTFSFTVPTAPELTGITGTIIREDRSW
jgi:PAS domain S-box-containing protein